MYQILFVVNFTPILVEYLYSYVFNVTLTMLQLQFKDQLKMITGEFAYSRHEK